MLRQPTNNVRFSLIRAAKLHEAQLLTDIAFAAKQHWGYSLQTMKLWMSALTVTSDAIGSNPTFLAQENSEPIAFYMLSTDGRRWELEHLWVLPSSMRRGIGKALLVHAAEVVRARGGKALDIDADPNAESFYRSCGAVAIGNVAAPIPEDSQRVRPQLTLTLG